MTRRTDRRSRVARKLTWMNMLASGAALLLACLALMVYDFVTVRAGMVRTRSIVAHMIGASTATALASGDTAAAERTLSSLSAVERIEGAGIYTPDGGLFASYLRDGTTEPLALPALDPARQMSYRFENGRLHVSRRILVDGRPAGVVYIRSDTQEVTGRLLNYAAVTLGVLLVSLGAALMVSRVVRRSVSQPIADLAALANRVSTARDYTVRADIEGQGEIGVLVSSFNEMLAQIEERDRSLLDGRRLLEQRVAHRTAALNAANKELEAFCYSVSHDLRSPLRSIDGFSQALAEDLEGTLDANTKGHLDRIRAATRRMGILIDDLLDLSRITRADMHIQAVDLSELARAVAGELASAHEDRHVDVAITGGLVAHGDPGLLRQVLENLLGNAWKFTSKQSSATIEFRAEVQRGEVVYAVADNGAGFDPAYADRLFGAFQRLHAATDFPGTGVGLAIVDRIIRRHGGRVWADAAVGRGATFFFTLHAPPPLVDEASSGG